MLSIRHVEKSFDKGAGARHVLQDVSLDIAPGEIFTLLGPSGCGKTTLLRLIAGLDSADAGSITFDGQPWVDVAQRRFAPPQKRQLGLVFQSYAIWPHLSVFDNLAYPLQQRGESAASIRTKVSRTLQTIGLTEHADRVAQQLSGGQQQRAALGRAIIAAPRLLLLDEPFSNLDVSLRQQLRLELKSLQASLGITMVLVTHDQEDAFALSDRIAVLNGGRVEQIGTAETLYDAPASAFVHDFIGKSATLRADVSDIDDAGNVHLLIGSAELGTIDQQRAARVWDGGRRVPRIGETLTLRVRPGGVRLQPHGAGIRVQIEHNILAGDRYETYVRFEDGQQLMVYQLRDAALRPGEQATLQLSAPPFIDTPSETASLSCPSTHSNKTSSWQTTSLRTSG